ncbi:MAG: dockerin type I domain-containing protein, partial [Firmicutes bacterium]|nr:dockerin type I domain-containing protein [Bacillota bacterium]
NIKIWVTGHSRGAAVANLVAANLTKNLPDMKNNIFAYTFATPSVSKMTYSEKRSYNNIFNILNPEDFITYMPLRRWEYYKYGIDKILPTKSIISKKNPIFSKMEDTFRSLTNVKFKSFPKGAVTTQNFLSDIFKFVAKNINDYYTKNIGSGGFVRTFKDYLYNLADQLIYGNPLLDTAPLILTYNYNIVSKISLGYFKKHTDNITFAHAPETYVSWVNSGLASELYIVPIEKTSYEFIIKCPVDINVYDTNNIIVGRVINNIVDETIEDSIVIDVEDDIKYLYLPSDETYEIEIIATNTGTMEYTVCEVLPDGTEIRRYNTYNIPLEIGKKMISNINNSSEVTPDYKTISVVNYAGTIIETISPTEIIEEVDLYNVTITLNANEGGCVFGDIICTKGDYITIGAEANEGWQFEGWYENNVKISDNAIYSFTATENRTLEARFVKYKIDGITKFMTGVTPNNNNVGEIIEYFITKGENANNWEFLNNNNILLKATDKVGTGTKIWNDSELIATVIIYGDIDGDGEITSADATLILRYIAEVGEFLNKYQKEAANVFGDGEITSANATLILRYIVGLENNLAP